MGGVIKKALKPVGKVVSSVVGGVLGQDEPDAPDVPAPSANAEEAARKAEQDRLAAENEAAALANTKAAERAKQRRAGSLLANGGGNSNAQTSSVLAYGKGRLGE